MTTTRTVLLLGAALTALAGPALAQTAPAQTGSRPASPPAQGPAQGPTQGPAQAPAPAQGQSQTPPAEAPAATVEGVTVTGRANDIRTSIDSVSYSVAEDLQNATGSLADALRAIPSVEVDPEGNVSLRGDANVTILVDGRPSALFEGQNRGQAVLQIPADQYARIEVMTNPSAAYRPDGSGGVINLISKPNRTRPGATTTGSVRANIGNDERYNFGVSAVYTKDKLTLSGDLSLRHDTFLQEVDGDRARYDVGSGRFLASRNRFDISGPSENQFGRLAAEYRLNAATQFNVEVRGGHFQSEAFGDSLYEFDDASGALAAAYRRSGVGGPDGNFAGVTGRVLHRFDDKGHEWSNEVRLDTFDFEMVQRVQADFTRPVAPSINEIINNGQNNRQVGFTSAYVRPLADNAKLRLGYELDAADMSFDNRVARGPSFAAAVPDPTVTNRFEADQQTHAVYATYERPFGKLTAQFGLRLEQTLQDLDQITSGVQASNDYFRAYPTLHLGYELAADQTLRASYSRRVQRPGAQDLNPFLSYQDPINYRSGNPNLKPQETDSFEITWQRRVEQTFYQATLFYRDTTGAFTPVTSDIGGGVFLTRPENLGGRTATGLEVVANGKLHPSLRYNASLTIAEQSIDAAGLVGAQDRSGTTVGGRLSLTWQPTPQDFLQVSGLRTGDQLLAQGHREASSLYNLGYRRKLSEKLSLQVTVRDLFDDFHNATIIDTPTLRDRTESLFGGRMVFIGLTWNFGNGRPRQEQFDFSTGQQGN